MAAGRLDFFCDAVVTTTGSWVARRMIVAEDDGRGQLVQCMLQYDFGINRGLRNTAMTDPYGVQYFVLIVHEYDPTFFVW